jgi:PAS domain S-box-containing protein
VAGSGPGDSALPPHEGVRLLVRALKGTRVVVWEMDGASRSIRYHLSGGDLEEMGFLPRFLPATREAWLRQVHPDDRAAVADALQAALEGADGLDVEYRFLLAGASAEPHWLATRGQVTPGGGMIGVTLDVTRRRRAEETAHQGQETLRAVFSASPDLINILDADGRVRLASPAVAKVLGYDPVREQGTTTLEWVHPDDRAAVAAALARVFGRGEEGALERFRYRHADGSWRVLESHGRRILGSDGSPSGVVVVSRDVTERVRMEAELRAAKEAAERSSRAKSAFLSRMSHELRTPLNAILGFARLLELESGSEGDREAAAQILRAGRHLLGLIDEVLDAARIEAGRLRVEVRWLPIGGLLAETLRMVAPLAAARSVSLACAPMEAGCEVRADPQRLRQVLLNLLSNGVKFNRPDGRVELRCETGGERLRIEVADTGPGIPRDQLARLFRPFERLDADSRGVEGTGLGLALSRGLVEAMGGTLTAASRPGEGSTFTIDLPARAAGTAAAQGKADPGAAAPLDVPLFRALETFHPGAAP